MSDEQSFEDYYAQAVFTEDKATARAAYLAGQESVIEAATATAKAYDGAQERVK